jgi:hypothetical protein
MAVNQWQTRELTGATFDEVDISGMDSIDFAEVGISGRASADFVMAWVSSQESS